VNLNGTVAMENMVVLQKIKNRLLNIWFSNPTLGNLSKKSEIRSLKRYIYPNIHKNIIHNIIHNSQDMEII
jgi:hypothetical protein